MGMSLTWLACFSPKSLIIACSKGCPPSWVDVRDVLSAATRTSVDRLAAPHLGYGHRVAVCLA